MALSRRLGREGLGTAPYLEFYNKLNNEPL
jgi:hypothetical protein